MRDKLRKKILDDTGIEIPDDAMFIRRSLGWDNKSAGCLSWFFLLKSGGCVGSSDGIRELMKSKKIEATHSRISHDVELHSS